jgi:hypothetical protein
MSRAVINLDELPEFKALDPKRQTVARGISQGVSYSKAIAAVGLNATRERRNPMLQRVLWLISMGVSPEGKPAGMTQDAAPSIYDEAAALERQYIAMTPDQQREYDAKVAEAYPANRRPCCFCGKMVFGGEGVCEECQPRRRDQQPEPAPLARAVSAPNTPVSKRCRTCGLPAGPRDIVCSDPTCVGAVDTF